MKKIIVLFVLLFALLTSNLYAQFSVSADIRTRAEMRNGYRELPVEHNPAFIIAQRSRLIFNFKDDKFRMRFSAQDSRVWGDESVYNSTGVFGDDASIEMNEGWVEFLMKEHFSFRIGRQVWAYDDERLLSVRNWNRQGIAYDAFLFKYQKSKNSFDIGLSWNNRAENNFGNDYRYFQTVSIFDTATQSNIRVQTELPLKIKSQNFIWWKRDLSNNNNITFLFLSTVLQQAETADVFHVKNTAGSNLNYKLNKFGLNASAYYQFGKDHSGKNVSAYLGAAKLSYKTNTFTFTLGCDYLSGHDASKQDSMYMNTNHNFDIFYGMRHGKYGFLDYFNQMDKATGLGGLVDVFFQLNTNINKKNSLLTGLHYFRLQNNVSDPLHSGTDFKALNKNLGYELDLLHNYNISEYAVLSSGFSYILAEKSLELLQGKTSGTTSPYWFYVILTVKPKLFSSEK